MAVFRHMREDNEKLRKDKEQPQHSLDVKKKKLVVATTMLDSSETEKRNAINDLKKYVDESAELVGKLNHSYEQLVEKYDKEITANTELIAQVAQADAELAEADANVEYCVTTMRSFKAYLPQHLIDQYNLGDGDEAATEATQPMVDAGKETSEKETAENPNIDALILTPSCLEGIDMETDINLVLDSNSNTLEPTNDH